MDTRESWEKRASGVLLDPLVLLDLHMVFLLHMAFLV
jgi:hypothetical protein